MIISSKIAATGMMLGMSAILALSDTVWLAVLGVIGSAITATVTIVLALKTTNRKIDELKENNDGKLTELMKASARADQAEGKAAGKAEEKLEAALIAGGKDAPEAKGETSTTTTKEPALNLVAKDVIVTKKSL